MYTPSLSSLVAEPVWLRACFLVRFCHKNCAFLILSNPAPKGFVLKVTDDMYRAAAARVMYYKVHDLWAACGPADCVFHSKIRLIGVCTISTFISIRGKASLSQVKCLPRFLWMIHGVKSISYLQFCFHISQAQQTRILRSALSWWRTFVYFFLV